MKSVHHSIHFLSFFVLLCSINFSCGQGEPEDRSPAPANNELDYIQLPAGFEIEYFARDIENARSLVVAENGTVFVGSRQAGKVYALKDLDGDHRSDTLIVLQEGWNQPNGISIKGDDLYVAEIGKVWKFPGMVKNASPDIEPELIYDGLPTEEHHGWRYIKFGPDGKLYIAIGAPCNICLEKEDYFASISRIDDDGSNFEVVHRGIRNSVGFDWDKETGYLWFTDNGADWMGDNKPADELNVATEEGNHYGYPFCHAGEVPDPEFGEMRDCEEFVPPAIKLGPHVAALGVTFLHDANVPEHFKNKLLIAEHGSWNRSVPIGYRVRMVDIMKNQAANYEDFAAGWLDGAVKRGRPVDVEIYTDGSILVSDDHGDAVYRIYYTGE